MNYDDYKTGLHDPNSPINEKQDAELLTIEELLKDGRIEEALNDLNDVRRKIRVLKEYAAFSDNAYLKNKLIEIYGQL